MSSEKKDLGEPTLPPCRVCGRRASGLHFGVITCEACKAFYKRSRGRVRPFVCRGKEHSKCVIKNGQTPLCSFCRLNDCLKAGMCREGINKGRCPIEKKAELLSEAREHQQQLLRQKMMNERRRITAVTTTIKEETAGHQMWQQSHMPQQTHIATEPQSPQLPLDLSAESFEVPPDLEQPFLDPVQVILNNPLTTIAMCEPSAPVPPIEAPVPRHRGQYGEFMNLLLGDDPSQLDQVEVSDAMDTANSFSGQRLMDIITWLDVVIQADMETQLYDLEECANVTLNIQNYKASRAPKEELIGPFKPLSHELYTEVYLATGIDVDNYRSKPSECMEDSVLDIQTYLEFLKRIPIYGQHDLNDRLNIAKGGFPAWLLLSSTEVYDPGMDCFSGSSENSVWTGDDFVTFLGPEFEGFLSNTLAVFQKANLTQEEMAVLKLYAIYQDRSFVQPKGCGAMIQEQKDFINDSLVYLFEAKRGKEEGKKCLAEVKNAVEITEKVSAVVQEQVREWPWKFPELNYPRLFLEIAGAVPEEELLVAVCANLKVSTHL